MKMRVISCLAVTFFILMHVSEAATSSNLFGFAGSYRGSVVLTGTSTASGPAFAILTSSKTKNSGALSVACSVSVSGSFAAITEDITIRPHGFSLVETLSSSQLAGAGTLSVHKKNISYSGTANSGGTTYSVTGTIRQTGKKLIITETLSSGGTVLTFTYTLKKVSG